MSSTENKNTGDSGLVAEELLQTGMPDLQRRCDSVHDTVSRGVFTLEEALGLYEVEEKEYRKFYPEEN